jgi:flavin reductase (DIM6/NTAB) family NADH-FMN oxidoreductase RutF
MTKIYSEKDILNMETRYRASFINSLGGFKSVVMVGTKSHSGQENLAVFNSLFHLGANPALCGLIVRPDISPRHTLRNILKTKFYTINHLNEDIFKAAHQTSARYPEDVSEFESTGLTPQYVYPITAPFVKQSLVRFACELQQHIPLKINGTTLLIGKIIHANIPEDALQEDGFIDLELAGSLTCSGLDSYHKTTKTARLSYAKTDKPVAEIK